jgi:hypothetical protein
MKKNITKPSLGLHNDNALSEQPKDTYRFALNAVNETEIGDLFVNSNEESNEECAELPQRFFESHVPLGKVYVGNGETIILSTSLDEAVSEIGIRDSECKYTTLVNHPLGFKVTNQIDVVFRLRRGCERVIYWVDGDNNKPYTYNLDKPEAFKTAGDWDRNKFELIRSYNSIPRFENIEVQNNNGQLPPGSYNIAIRYLDESLNPTEFITTSETINIYNDNTTRDFLKINGSINHPEDFRKFPTTNKSIKVTFSDLDETFLFYQLAFIEATNSSGLASDINYTKLIPTTKDFFVYTGINFETKGTENEILAFNTLIDSADHIEQSENRLLLANVRGSRVNFCKLQQYASKIKTDVITKKVFTNVLSNSNTKSPTVNFDGVGYMPGEIYSLGIVYVFKDGSLSPAYHIPGKSPGVNSATVFKPGVNTYPMDNNNNSLNSLYTESTSCNNEMYWGYDSEGLALKDAPVRHHRFPLRSAIGLDLVKEEGLSVTTTATFYQLKLSVNGTINTPCTVDQQAAGQCPVVQAAPPFQAQVEYTVDGVTKFLAINIDPAKYFNSTGTYLLNLDILSESYTSATIVIVKIEEANEVGFVTDVSGAILSPKGLVYTTSIEANSFEVDNKVYSTEILGLQFSGIELPPIAETNGKEVVGYYIVRNERTENEKTVLDSAVLTPLLKNNKYISHGLMGPDLLDDSRISKGVYGLITPEHKFKGRQYSQYTEIVQEGTFDIIRRTTSKSRYLDVQDGTSFDAENNKTSDDDGWSLKAITRDNETEFTRGGNKFDIPNSQIEDTFYLNSLESRDVNNDVDTIYNTSGDNKIGIVQLNSDNPNTMLNKFPYVYLKRDLADPYSTFRILPYIKISSNVETNETTTVFGGDSYVSPMRYLSTCFWDNRIAKRAVKENVWRIIVGSLIVLAGALLIAFPVLNIATPLIIAAGISVIGGGALFISSGIKKETWAKAYLEEYSKGLKDTLLDEWVNNELNYAQYPQEDTPEDDEIQWIADCVTDLWFESQINTSLRYKMNVETPTFLDAPGKIETGREGPEEVGKDNVKLSASSDVFYVKDVSLYPFTKLDKQVMDKLLAFNSNRKDNRLYIGHCLGEWYEINPDYERVNRQKLFFHLGIEYDCCSKCQETFPHRIHYSEQAFQEELTDNYKVFLPNNYRDIEGETGEITDLFKIQNNIYIHTEEALWHLPQQYQERITDSIVSFIGSGEYFATPPRKILDENHSSGGTRHKWATIKTKYGVFFISELERKVFKFNGNDLVAISDIGLSNWFKEKGGINLLKEYYLLNGNPYPYYNNPSNKIGVGYISTYDSKKERVIFTKKDYILSDEFTFNEDVEICIKNNVVTVFPDFNTILQNYNDLGFIYKGLENCRMKFEKQTLETFTELRQVTTVIKNTADIVVHMDMSGSFSAGIRTQIKNAVLNWKTNFLVDNPDWIGNLYFSEQGVSYTSQRAWRILNFIQTTTNIFDEFGGVVTPGTIGNDIIVVSFVNENDVAIAGGPAAYHTAGINNPVQNGLADFYTDYADHVARHDSLVLGGGSFTGLIYPIVYNSGPASIIAATNGFLQHALAAVRGIPYTAGEFSVIPENLFCSDWALLGTSLQGVNPYPDDGLELYGWEGKWNRGWNGAGDVITSTQFQEDMDEFLIGGAITEIKLVEYQKVVSTIEYVDGNNIEIFAKANNAWTISFSLKANHWASWHSYLPNFYYNIPEKFYSWIQGSTKLWRHNKIGEYQKFYGVSHPYIVEFVSLSDALQTKVYEDIMLHTEAKKYNSTTKEYTDERFITFNKAIMYNTRQCTGELTLQVKDNNAQNYMSQQVVSLAPGTIAIDRNERNWTLNDIRDVRIDYTQSIFNSDILSVQDEYYIDKVLNAATMSFAKDWKEKQSLRDKYLVIRLIFDNFEDVKLLMNYSIENETESFR